MVFQSVADTKSIICLVVMNMLLIDFDGIQSKDLKQIILFFKGMFSNTLLNSLRAKKYLIYSNRERFVDPFFVCYRIKGLSKYIIEVLLHVNFSSFIT